MRHIRELLDSISTGIVALDANLQIVALNAAGQALLETSEARCIGQHAGSLILHSADWLQKLKRIGKGYRRCSCCKVLDGD